MIQQIYIVSGLVNSGKSSRARRIVARWRDGGVDDPIREAAHGTVGTVTRDSQEPTDGARHTVGGIVTQALLDENGNKTAYFAENVRTGKRRVLVATSEFIGASGGAHRAQSGKVGRFEVFQSGFRFAYRAITNAVDCDAICIDEIGTLEMRGEGHANALRWLTQHYTGTVLLVMRANLRTQLIDCFSLRQNTHTISVI